MCKGCLLRSLADGVNIVGREVQDKSCCVGFAPGEAHSPFRNSTRTSVDSVMCYLQCGAQQPATEGSVWLESLTSRNVANAWLGKPAATKLSSRATQRDLMRRDLETAVRT
jgi:hypothetical protein